MANVLSDDPNHLEYRARTDMRQAIIFDTPWFYLPYPGKDMKVLPSAQPVLSLGPLSAPSETPFKWHFAGGPKVARFCLFTRWA